MERPGTNEEYTPQQAASYQDDDIAATFTRGELLPDGFFDAVDVTKKRYQDIHRWDMTDEQARAVVVYMRSLAPAPQLAGPMPFQPTALDAGDEP